jgi:hypothetical protein
MVVTPRTMEEFMTDRHQPEGVEVEILSLGPSLYSKTNEIVGRPVSRIKDTTSQAGGLPILLDGIRIGSASALTYVVHDGHEALCYLARLTLIQSEINSLLAPDRKLWAAGIKAAMGLNGIYPTAVHLGRTCKDTERRSVTR